MRCSSAPERMREAHMDRARENRPHAAPRGSPIRLFIREKQADAKKILFSRVFWDKMLREIYSTTTTAMLLLWRCRVAETEHPSRSASALVPHALPRAAGARCCARPHPARPPGVPQGSLSAPGRPARPHLCPALSITRRTADAAVHTRHLTFRVARARPAARSRARFGLLPTPTRARQSRSAARPPVVRRPPPAWGPPLGACRNT